MTTLVSRERTETPPGSRVTSFVGSSTDHATTAAAGASGEGESAVAMHGRGVGLFTGKGQSKDQAGAVAVWQACVAAHNWAPSKVLLGMAHWSGEGCPEDVEKAVGILRAVGKEGAEGAQGAFFLGMAYTHGDKVEKDRSRGLRWLRQAAKFQHREAMYELGALMVATDDPDQLRRGCDWITAAAEKGHSRAQEFVQTAERAAAAAAHAPGASLPMPTPAQVAAMDAEEQAAKDRGGADDDWTAGAVLPANPNMPKKKGKKGRGK